MLDCVPCHVASRLARHRNIRPTIRLTRAVRDSRVLGVPRARHAAMNRSMRRLRAALFSAGMRAASIKPLHSRACSKIGKLCVASCERIDCGNVPTMDLRPNASGARVLMYEIARNMPPRTASLHDSGLQRIVDGFLPAAPHRARQARPYGLSSARARETRSTHGKRARPANATHELVMRVV